MNESKLISKLFFFFLELAHSCTGGRGLREEWDGKYRTPEANFKTLVNKNAIKPEIEGPPTQFFMKTLTPIWVLAKTSGTPSPGFSTRVHLWTCSH
jgi:hypothetical protein